MIGPLRITPRTGMVVGMVDTHALVVGASSEIGRGIASKHGLAGLAAATFPDVRDRDVRVSLISPGLVSAGAGLMSPAGQRTPDQLLAAGDVAAAVRFILSLPPRACVTQLHIQPQRTPIGH
jgi:NADP-dependent 3-hydroxy acid dehydrogenase YdfG